MLPFILISFYQVYISYSYSIWAFKYSSTYHLLLYASTPFSQQAETHIPFVIELINDPQKRDPPATKKTCIITLTRIFLLTHDHQSLVREITTPSLPGFITSCLNISRSDTQGHLVETVLQAFIELIPHHPTSFRPFVGQIRSLVSPLIASTPSSVPRRSHDDSQDEQSMTISALLARYSRRLYVLSNACAPKNTASEEWARSLHAMIEATHRTADLVYRAVYEDWESSSSVRPRFATEQSSYAVIVSDSEAGPLDLLGWRGIHAGVERLDGLLQTLQAFLVTPTSMAVALPVGSLLDVVNRMLSILPPSNGRIPRTNPEISREEREGLWTGLTQIHTSAMGLLSLLISRLGYALAPTSHLLLEEIFWVLQNEHAAYDVRRTAYELTSQFLILFGPSLPKTLSKPLSVCIKLCCEDLLPSSEQTITKEDASPAIPKKPARNGSSTINADSYLKTPSNHYPISKHPTDLQLAAAALLPLLLTHLSPNFLSFSLRTQIDRTAILTKNKQAMLASVLNPPMKRKGRNQASSIMPVLARSYPECMEVEALIRPRMPLLHGRRGEEGESESDEEEMIMEVPDTYATRRDEAVVPVDLQMSTSPMQDSSVVEPRPDVLPPPQTSSQISQPASLEIPETQSTSINPRKRDLDSTSDSQISTRPSDNTISQPALSSAVDSEEKIGETTETSTSPSYKRPRLDQPPTTTKPPIDALQIIGTTIPDTQAAQAATATAGISAPLASLSNTQNQAAQAALGATVTPAPPLPQTIIQDSGEPNSSDDENFVIPAIDPTMDTDEEESEDDGDGE